MKVLIVGGGIGGLTLAAFLKECEIDFNLVEIAKDWNKKGFSLGIWNNGRDILNKLGLAEFFDKEGEMIKDYFVYNGKGKILKKYNLNDFYINYGSAYTHLNRSKLHEALLSKIGEQKVSMNTSITSILQEEDGAIVIFSNGAKEKYDLVIGADGIHSKVRKLVFGQKD